MIRRLIFILLTLSSIDCFCQKRDYVWIFDQGIQMDFNSSSPTVTNTGLHGMGVENYASISSDSGSLLFHINGNDSMYSTSNTYEFYFSDVYDKNHIIMPDGDSLLSDFSSTQGSLIIPFPADTNLYYVFNLNTIPQLFTGYPRGLYYSVVDMTANSGLGNVVSKNINLYQDTITEKLSACKHGNGRDWWILIHDFNNDRFVAFLASPSGITGPFYQNIGTAYINGGNWGPIVFSRDGTRCAVTGDLNIINVFDFDRCTGLISNPLILNTNNSFNLPLYGCSLSPNGNVLYVSDYSNVFQYDLTAPNVIASKLTIWTNSDPNISFLQHKLAPNNKIYISSGYGLFSIPPNPVANTYNMNLSIINNPNAVGINCSYSPWSVSLNGNKTFGGFPNSVNYNLESNGVCNVDVNETSKGNNLFQILPNPSKDVIFINAPFAKNSQLRIIDITGKIVLSEKISQSKRIDVSSLSMGIYTIEIINTDNTKMTSRFMKE